MERLPGNAVTVPAVRSSPASGWPMDAKCTRMSMGAARHGDTGGRLRPCAAFNMVYSVRLACHSGVAPPDDAVPSPAHGGIDDSGPGAGFTSDNRFLHLGRNPSDFETSQV